MSREIKFRAWDGRDKRMLEPDEVFVGGGYPAMFWHYDTPASRRPSVPVWEFHVMQFTGLKDKNGVEIYEGDIIRIGQETQYLVSEPEIVSIVWDDKCAGFLTSNHRYIWLFLNLDTPDAEVIGNIYEQPELLEGGK